MSSSQQTPPCCGFPHLEKTIVIAEEVIDGDGTDNKPNDKDHEKSAEEDTELKLGAQSGHLTDPAKNTEAGGGGMDERGTDFRIIIVFPFLNGRLISCWFICFEVGAKKHRTFPPTRYSSFHLNESL